MIICATGHRNADLPCKYNEKDTWLLNILKDLEKALEEENVSVVVSGLALGWDTWFAEAGLKLGIPLHSYVPFKGQENKWFESSKKRYYNLIDKSEKVVYVCDSFSMAAYQKRNEAMVDNADKVFALWSGKEHGGTYNCIKYAKKVGKPIRNFYPKESQND